jgi:hypothetical protein
LGDVKAVEVIKLQEQICTRIIVNHGGQTLKTQGDSVMARFRIAPDAVQAAFDIREEIERYNRHALYAWPVVLRLAIHCGEAVEDSEDVLGQTVNIAASLNKQAGPQEVLISRQVLARLPAEVQDRFDYSGPEIFKGVQIPIEVYGTGNVSTEMSSGTRITFERYLGWPLSKFPHADSFLLRAGTDGQPRRELVVGGSPVSIGKHKDCDLCFPQDAYLSRCHAVLAVVDRVPWIFDMDSKAGVFVEDPELAPGHRMAVVRRGPLRPGQTVSLSSIRLTVEPVAR